jgi:hypothetical protein
MHFNPDRALDMVDGTMPGAEYRFWNAHIDSCSECAVELHDWSTLAGWVKREHLLNAPADVLTSAKKIFQTQKTPQSYPFLRQIVASITFDSFAQPAFAGSRAQLAAEGQVILRQVVLRAEEFDIHIRISTLDDRRELLGQILPRGSSTFIKDARLHLRHEEERIGSSKVNDLGEFQFSDVPDGLLSLQIDLPHVTVISALYSTM